jgi:Flp pilus assembly protein TadD
VLAARTPNDPDLTMRYGVALAMAGELDAAREQLARMTRVHDGWAKVVGRLVAAGLLPNDPALLAGLISSARDERAL